MPTLEVHVNTPLNHRGVFNFADPASTPDLVDLTGGIHFEFKQHTTVGIAFVTPVSGPRMFNWELLAQLGWRY